MPTLTCSSSPAAACVPELVQSDRPSEESHPASTSVRPAPSPYPSSSDTLIDESPEYTPPFSILIIGAGLSGLAAAYALRQTRGYKEGTVGVRVVEKRLEAGCNDMEGYPIHLSEAGRSSLSTLLTPTDAQLLTSLRSSIPIIHDGITVTSAPHARRVWWMLRDVGVRPMVERGGLMRVLKGGAGEVEWGVEVEGVRELVGEGEGVEVVTKRKGRGGEMEEEVGRFDLVIGADGMYSPTRHALLTSTFSFSCTRGPALPGNFRRFPQTVINLRASSQSLQRWTHDPQGTNLVYGESFSATLLPLGGGTTYVALTVPSKWLDSAHQAKVEAEACEPTVHGEFRRVLEADEGWARREAYPIWTAKRTVGGRGRVVLIGDAAHGMPPFCGAGASAGIKDAVELVEVVSEVLDEGGGGAVSKTLDKKLEGFRKSMARRNDPLIKDSVRLLWLVQAERWYEDGIRRAVFWMLEMSERWSGQRAARMQELENANANRSVT